MCARMCVRAYARTYVFKYVFTYLGTKNLISIIKQNNKDENDEEEAKDYADELSRFACHASGAFLSQGIRNLPC